MCRLINGAWEGKEERAHGLTGPKTYDTLQRRTALPSKKIFLPRYLGKNIFLFFKTAAAKSLKTLNFSGLRQGAPTQELLLRCRLFVAVFLSFDFRLLWLHFLSVLPSHLSFWPFGLSFPFVFACSPSFPFICPFSPFISFQFGLLTLHFLIFWPFGPSFPFIFAFSPFILAFWAFISFHFCLLTVHFLSFWPFESSFPFILTPWVFM